jgi:hypothetical protein
VKTVREYRRAIADEVPALEAAGWRGVAATLFGDREVSALLVREPSGRCDRDDDIDLDSVSEPMTQLTQRAVRRFLLG